MRVTERRPAPWRHPVLAPAFAAAIAFAAVALTSLGVAEKAPATGNPEQVTVRVSAASTQRLDGVTVQIRDSGSGEDSGSAEVCLEAPTGWRFTDTEQPGQQCQQVTDPAADVWFRLEPA